MAWTIKDERILGGGFEQNRACHRFRSSSGLSCLSCSSCLRRFVGSPFVFEALFIVTRAYTGDTHIARFEAHIQSLATLTSRSG
jgi:hypothetical protein